MANIENGNIKDRLILAGLEEIGIHGIEDFSLRRVSNACGLSCAAPYRHFKDKNDFILGIVNHIVSGWKLMETHLCSVYSSDRKELIRKLCLSIVSFNLANPEYKAVFIMGRQNAVKSIIKAIEKIFETLDGNIREVYPDKAEEYIFLLHSVVYGAVIDSDSEGDETSLSLLERILKNNLI